MTSENLNAIYNFLQLSDSIATAGQPTKEQFTLIRDAGYQLVINLALPTSTNAIADEQQLVESQEMQYVHIPVLWEQPTLDDFDRFLNTMNENSDKKIFVHCAMNMRVSAFMYLYRRIHEHLTDEVAKQELHKIWEPNDTWKTFIEKALQQHLEASN